MTDGPLGEQWKRFVAVSLPQDIPQHILDTLQIAFYSGAKACQFAMFEKVQGSTAEDLAKAIEHIQIIVTEMDAFILQAAKDRGVSTGVH